MANLSLFAMVDHIQAISGIPYVSLNQCRMALLQRAAPPWRHRIQRPDFLAKLRWLIRPATATERRKLQRPAIQSPGAHQFLPMTFDIPVYF